ncbi:MAG: hypothetical protein BGO12_08390 [Verrucomicrobia bacterium 61-8]|nr:MAG: hypothetical protein BGO12_08390 [Verrucomicrobia bacterium 61-8]
MSVNKLKIISELEHYGIKGRSSAVRWFHGDASPELIDYLDLVAPAASRSGNLPMLDGVAENQDRPLLFFINEGRLASSSDQQAKQLADMRRTLACRGDRAYLAVIRPGSLSVIPVSLTDKTQQWKLFQAGTGEALTFFSRLALGRCEEVPTGPDVEFLFQEMFRLVEATATRLEQLKVKRSDVLSLVGRALFFRFLTDRSIATDGDLKKIAPNSDSLLHCFDNAENAAATSQWLDKTFNGDFLPLTDEGNFGFFESLGRRTGQRVFHHLGGIVRGEEPVGDDGFQLRLPIDWGDLDFAHIPVGLLSQVYEKLSWKWDSGNARNTSVHYTPRNIAATLVGEAFDGLSNAHKARVLDPACGAGVFLVVAFRRLYRELWEETNLRPQTAAIRQILEQQLTGFDISDSALKLTALSLYLTAIELDPDPSPPEKLKFKALRHGRNAMLFDWRKEDDKNDGPVVGSLGTHVPISFNSSFDLVICNPPWTTISEKYKSVAEELNGISKAIVASLDPEIGTAYQNPNSVPDVPFLWKSSQWCRPDGRIAMALPARTLFKQGSAALFARKAIFKLIEVTGIINASNLRKTKVWPDMDQPFMLLFARNRRPKSDYKTHFISPHTDYQLNGLGEMRIDSQSSQRVEINDNLETAWIWKALAVGTALDIEVVHKIQAAGGKPLEEYWTQDLNLICRNGYKVEPDQPQKDASSLKAFRDLRPSSNVQFVVDVSKLEYFNRDTACRPRIDDKAPDPLRVYRGPLALIKENPGADRTSGWALYCASDVAYNQSFYGYSGANHPEGDLLVRYLQLFVHSRIWLHYALLTSAKLGVERPNIYKSDLDNFPLIPLESIEESEKRKIQDLSDRLHRAEKQVFADIDLFFGRLYGLTKLDVEVIEDTLTVREPNDELGVRASKVPSKPEIAVFLKRVESILRPLFKALGKSPELKLWQDAEQQPSPFIVFTLAEKGTVLNDTDAIFRDAALPLAHETGATRIIKETQGGIFIGILRQYRYWTPSRARMLCAEIIREHLVMFEE